MKRILFVAFATTLLAASCSKTEVINPEGNQIGFSTGMNKLTKSEGTADAAAVDLANLKAQDFRVWATYVQDDQHVAGNQANTFFDGIQNLPITWNTPKSGEWNTDKDYYWPGKDKELKFFAVSGGQQINVDASPVAIADDRTALVVNSFNVTNTGYNADLMVADFVKQHQADREVNLKFHHALSKVEFLFKTIAQSGSANPIRVFVQKVEVKDLATTGNLVVTPTTSNPSTQDETTTSYEGTQIPVTLQWTSASVNANQLSAATITPLVGAVTPGTDNDFVDDWEEVYKAESTEEDNFPKKIEGQNPTDEDKKAMEVTATGSEPAQVFTTWLMLPQEISEKQVEITYLINERRFTSIFPLGTASLTAWAQNQYVRYTVTIAPNLISFNPDVKGWDQYDASEYQN
ncbi:MAG: fimbrillin family protein [Bacteroidales bacterium]|nr:fimbrillin family protein [Bacteroidales bacterium]